MKISNNSDKKGNSKRVICLLISFGLIISALIIFGINIFGNSEDDNQNVSTDSETSAEETYAVIYDDKSGVYSTQGVDVVIEEEQSDLTSPKSEGTKKKIYLTFDDGPSKYTNTILDILDSHNVKGTFFVLKKEDSVSVEAYKRIADEGHTLAMHSTSHVYDDIYSSKEAFRNDIRELQEFLYSVTGIWSRTYRFPGGSSNHVSKTPMEELTACLEEDGITYFDWNIMSGDAVKGGLDTATIVRNCTKDIDKFDECVILMHDAASRYTTVEALDKVISIIEARGDCVILPITDETNPIQHVLSQD